MITSQDRLQLAKIVQKYRDLEKEISEVESLQESLKKKIEKNLLSLEETRQKEKKLVEKLEKKYKRKFTPSQLIEIIFND
jgi:hypothetical protein